MIALTDYKNRRIGVLGLGSSGMSCYRALIEAGAEVFCWDDHTPPAPEWPPLTPPESKHWQEIDTLIVSPSFSLLPEKAHALIKQARANNIPVLGDFELFANARKQGKWQAPVIAITGTNGKSTTAGLVAHMLEAQGKKVQLGGNIGTPILDLDTPEASDKDTVFVLEISSYQIDIAPSFIPDITVLLNIAPDHTEHHGSMEAYVAAKAALLMRGSRAIIGIDDKWSSDIAAKLAEKARPPVSIRTSGRAGNKAGIFVEDGVLYENPTGHKKDEKQSGTLPAILAARQNWQNAAAAYAVARQLGMSTKKAFEAMASFKTLPHRMEEVAQCGGVRFVNDSKATNAAATAAVLGENRNIYWIAGGRAKTEGFASLRQVLGEGDIKQAFLIGEAAEQMHALIEPHAPVRRCASLEEAVEAAGNASRHEKEAVVLFSPACASFDKFRNFAERGDAFRSAVQQWQEKAPAAQTASPEKPVPLTPKRKEPLASSLFTIAAGGTGGHVLPAQSLAAELRRRGHRVHLITDRRTLGLVNPALWERVDIIPAAPVAGKGITGALASIIPNLRSMFAARRLTRRHRPAVMIGFGGYVSAPPMIAARLAKIPCLIHQQGRSMGQANRLLGRFSQAIATALPDVAGVPRRHAHKLVLTGMPLRPEILAIAERNYAPPAEGKTFHLLVFGGSQGALRMTRKVLEALLLLPQELRQRTVLTMQCPETELARAHHILAGAELRRIYLGSFFDNIATHIARAHLVLTRAGALSVSELVAAARPAMYIPITGASGGEQTANAEFISKAGAGWLTHETGLKAHRLAERIASLAASPAMLLQAHQAALSLREEINYRDGARQLAMLAEDLARPETSPDAATSPALEEAA